MLLHPKPQNLNDLTNIVTVNQELRTVEHVLRYSQSIIGDYKVCARSNDHFGWVICDGRVLDRTQYNALYEVIGTSFGSTNSTNFKLPDFRGKVFGSLNISSNRNNAFSVRNLGDDVGEETHTLTIPEMPTHNHDITDPGHTHAGDKYPNGIQNTDNAFGTEQAANETMTTGSVNSSITGISINNKGGNQPHNNMQPTLFGGNIYIFAGLVP